MGMYAKAMKNDVIILLSVNIYVHYFILKTNTICIKLINKQFHVN